MFDKRRFDIFALKAFDCQARKAFRLSLGFMGAIEIDLEALMLRNRFENMQIDFSFFRLRHFEAFLWKVFPAAGCKCWLMDFPFKFFSFFNALTSKMRREKRHWNRKPRNAKWIPSPGRMEAHDQHARCAEIWWIGGDRQWRQLTSWRYLLRRWSIFVLRISSFHLEA